MNQNYCKSCNRSRRRGLTLIEVIAATTLLATLLVAALTGFGRHREQLRRALAKQNAVAAMDQLMADWFAEKDWSKLPTSGACRQNPKLVWTMRKLPAESLGGNWPVHRLRFDICSLDNRLEVLASLELLAADEQLKAARQRSPEGAAQ